MNQEKIKNKIAEEEKIIKEITLIKTRISYIRLVIFILFVVFLSLAFFNKIYGIVLSVLLFIGFVVISVFHHKYFNIIEDATYKVNVYKDLLNRYSDLWKKTNETGNEFLTKKYFESDLDLFGKNSIYSYISFSKTAYGRAYLAKLLNDPDTSINSIKERQDATLELEEDYDFNIKLRASSYKYAALNKDMRVKTLDSALDLIENEMKFDWYKIIIALLFTISLIISIVLASLKKVPLYFPFLNLGINYFVSQILFKDCASISQSMAKLENTIFGYQDLINDISNHDFKSKLLNDYKNDIKMINNKSLKSYKTLETIAESRNNIIFSIILNGLCFIDAILLLGFSSWQKKYSKVFRNALESVGKVEALVSLTTISYTKEESTLPLIDSNFTFDSIKHPLINEEKCVDNSFNFSGLNIITGSNMSGKTTFMRSIGTNYVLFLAGSKVCAKSFKAPILKLFTSMKVTDDVNNNISTFYGEILRVKEIVGYIKENKPMLVLIDEIFKGTNTKDRIVGALSVAKKLNKENIYAIITTHDPELCEAPNVKNYHFLEHYEDDKILFDYKIHDGISKTRNAIYLLKLAGIIDEEA